MATAEPVVYFDERARGGKGAWRVVTKKGVVVDCPTFHTEAEARASIGLKGGSTEPAYRPSRS